MTLFTSPLSSHSRSGFSPMDCDVYQRQYVSLLCCHTAVKMAWNKEGFYCDASAECVKFAFIFTHHCKEGMDFSIAQTKHSKRNGSTNFIR